METQKPKAHFIAPELLNPTNPITVCLIGAGGTGSQVLTGLARMSHSLQQLGHAGFSVMVWDDDIITDANRGRQLFADSEVGLYKATALIARSNRFFGTMWKSVNKPFTADTNERAAIYISCVDTAEARFAIAEALSQLDIRTSHSDTPRYWMDFGNGMDSGQVILSTIAEVRQPASEKFITIANLPKVTDEFTELLAEDDDDDNTPSCSLAEALEKQDLYINSVLAQLGCGLLWQFFRQGLTTQRGVFLNLKEFRSQPLAVG